MAKTRTTNKRRPALTPAARENQLIGLAMDQAEQQLIDGTASSQVVTHFLRLGSSKMELEKEKLERENKLLVAKVESLESSQRIEELYEKAIKAMRNYGGHGEEDEY